MKLLVIGKAKKPRAFKNWDSNIVIWRKSTNAWITSEIFREWFYDYFVPTVTKYLKGKKLPVKAHLYIDNCPAHPDSLSKGGIVCKFLPPNTTSLIQPMDQGILRQMKSGYKKKLMSQLVGDDDQNIVQAWKEYNIRDALINLVEAWDNIKPENHQKAWLKLMPHNEVVDFEGFNKLTKDSKSSEQHLKEFLKTKECFKQCEDEDFQEWFDQENNDKGYGDRADHEILHDVQNPSNNESDGEDDEDRDDEYKPEMTLSEAAECARKLLSDAIGRGIVPDKDIIALRRVRDIFQQAKHGSYRQRPITSFFDREI